ncbi:MAG: LysM peptidoglycan-binding domain-containing protein [Verrucomicrobiales bacterium]
MKILAAVVGFASLFGHPAFAQEEDVSDLFTNVYVVPPTFLDMGEDRRPNAKEILGSAGIVFPDGTSAIYNPATSQLIVRNTQDQMELVDAYIESITATVEKQIYFSITEVQLDEKPADDFHFGTLSELEDADPRRRVRTFSDQDRMFDELSRPPRSEWPERNVVKAGLAGVYTDPQFQVLIRALGDKYGEERIIRAPSVMLRSGQSTILQVEEKRWAATAVLGADEYAIDIEAHLPIHGEPFYPDHPDLWRNTLNVTIWDGQSAAWAEEKKDGSFRIVFLKAHLMDPAGLPIHDPTGRNAPEHRTGSKPAPEERSEQGNSDVAPGLTAEQRKLVKEADEAALRGSQLLADEYFESAAEFYARALELLPKHEMTAPRRRAYEKQINRTRSLAGTGKTKFHIVKEGESLHDIARRFDLSVEAVKRANKLKSDTLLVGQLLAIPGGNTGNPRTLSKIEAALVEVIIPSYEVKEISLVKAIGLIQLALLSNLDSGLFPDLAPRFVFEDVDDPEKTKITLRLSNVPVAEALRYVTHLANCQYEVEDDRIVISRH